MADLDSERQGQTKDCARMMRRISFFELGLTAFLCDAMNHSSVIHNDNDKAH